MHHLSFLTKIILGVTILLVLVNYEYPLLLLFHFLLSLSDAKIGIYVPYPRLQHVNYDNVQVLDVNINRRLLSSGHNPGPNLDVADVPLQVNQRCW